MSILNIKSKRKRKYTIPKKEAQNLLNTYQNVLKQDFCASDENHKWLSDITYLPSKDGIEYLSCIKDLKDKSIISYHISNKNDLTLVMETLNKAVYKMHDGIVLHTDQGSQYCSQAYHNFIKEHGLVGSMSRKATPYDNAPMESFFSILKNEELRLYRGLTMQQTREKVKQFIYYYNYERPQWELKKLTPIEYGSQLNI